MKNTIKIGISSGDLNGIGIEILYKALDFFSKKAKNLTFLLFCNFDSLIDYLDKMKFNFKIYTNEEVLLGGNLIKIVPLNTFTRIEFGRISKESAKHSIESITKAMAWAIEKKIDAVVTLPIHKKAVSEVGFPFPGHTEFIARLCGENTPLMLFAHKKLRVALATIHIPIQQISQFILSETLTKKIQIFHNTLEKDFRIHFPKIAILGLNPHCGESGIIGNEEEDIIIPSIRVLKNNGYNLFGPYPADSFFGTGYYEQFDGILAMYHDQGLIPFKLISKMSGVNITANLPIIRTSPDHGTAFDIAGKNYASPASLIESIKFAIKIVENRRRFANNQ